MVKTGLEQIPGLHSGMRPAFDAVGEGKMLWVRERYPEAVSALLSSPRHGTKLPVLCPRCAIVIGKEMGFSYGKAPLTDPLLRARDVDVLVLGSNRCALLLA